MLIINDRPIKLTRAYQSPYKVLITKIFFITEKMINYIIDFKSFFKNTLYLIFFKNDLLTGKTGNRRGYITLFKPL
jgi:hypothetical protein